MKFDCQNCGDVDAVLINGYSFAERLLEGVMFKVFYKDGELIAEVMPEDADFFSDFNEIRWLDKCLKKVNSMEGDVGGSCPCCKEDIYFRPDDEARSEPVQGCKKCGAVAD